MTTPTPITLFDTTLRDGEQSPGIALSHNEKVEIAQQLATLGIDVIEAGFPAASQGDFEGVAAIAAGVGTSPRPDGKDPRPPVIAALCRATPGDIARGWEAIAAAHRPRIHTFISTSPVHMEKKLRMSPAQVLAAATAAVTQARQLCEDVEFSAEDATRTQLDFLTEVFAAAIAAGATTINVPDTVGYLLPDEYAALLTQLQRTVPGAQNVVWSVHCHDDLGLATASTLAGIRAGARQAEVTINGIGERAGNTACEEVVMALHTHRHTLGYTTNVTTTQIARASRLVSMLTCYPVQPNKAIVGANAFSHESGIHQHGMLADRTTYEIMDPREVGLGGTRLVLGKHSGRHAFADALTSLGVRMAPEALDRAFARFKELADRKVQLVDEDLVALATEESGDTAEQVGSIWRLEHFEVSASTGQPPQASVRLSRGEQTAGASVTGATTSGSGMIDAACLAVAKAAGVDAQLLAFTVAGVTPGTDAVGDVTVQVEVAGQRTNARGVSTDVVEASARAFLNAINKVMAGVTPTNRTGNP